jgi:HSP20 family molecular chaperone IbpA
MDIYRTRDNIIVKLELPGVRWEDIHIKFEAGILTIYGENEEDQPQQYHARYIGGIGLFA